MSDTAPLDLVERRFLIGMVHLPPLLGQRGASSLDDVEAYVVREAMTLAEAGFDGILIENFGDTPFYPDSVPPHTISAMTRLAYAVREFLAGLEGGPPSLGINVLRNDAKAALAIAAAVGADFVRVNVHNGAMLTDQGLIQGQAHETVRYRDQIAPNVAIFADVQVKHAAPLTDRAIEEEAEELWLRARSDSLIVTGARTGDPVSPELVNHLRSVLPGCPIYAGSGASPEQLDVLLPAVSGLIVGTWLKLDGRTEQPIDPSRAAQMVETVRAWEQASQPSLDDDV